MILSKLQGGLGNQIFQWAAGKSLSIDLNLPYYLDNQFYINNNSIDTKRPLDINLFSNIKNLNFVGLISDKNFYQIGDSFNYENFNNIKNSILHVNNKPNIFLNGYWQSEKYFINNKNNILDELKISDIIKNKLYQKYENIDLNNSVSIHIRRTDYVTSNGFHPVMTKKYYLNALEESNSNNMTKLVFSDDITWCKENLKLNDIIFIENNSNIEDLYLMSLCKNNIIANSSFSWWGAYLNENIDKKIISLLPENWFGKHANINTSDIIPNSWKKIDG